MVIRNGAFSSALVVVTIMASSVSCASSDGREETNDPGVTLKESNGYLEYGYTTDGCRVHLAMKESERYGAAISTGWTATKSCDSVSYIKKISGLEKIVDHIIGSRGLGDSVRFGPGPINALCEDPIVTRLARSVMKLGIGYPDSMRRENVVRIFEDSEAFLEYTSIFSKHGYQVIVHEMEGVVFHNLKHNFSGGEAGVGGDIWVPCNAMVYFSASKNDI